MKFNNKCVGGRCPHRPNNKNVWTNNPNKQINNKNVGAGPVSGQNAITLIALIITIIILLILASVAINLITGENGLIAKARWAAYVTEYEMVKEKQEIYTVGYQLNKMSSTNRIATTRNIVIKTEVEREAMYPIGDKIDISTISTSLRETIKQIEGLTDSNLTDETLVNLYQVDLDKIGTTAKKTYAINIISGELYSIEYEKYEGKLWHTPRLGIEKTKINKAGTYEITVDAGQTVSWNTLQMYYNKYVENSVAIKIYTSDDGITWTEETIGEETLKDSKATYDLSELQRSQYLKIEIKVTEINGENSDVDYTIVNFYKYKELDTTPQIETTGVEKIGDTYTVATAEGTGTVIQTITIPKDQGEYMLDLGDNYGNPTSTIKITNPDGTTVEITTTLEAGEGVEQVKLLVKETNPTSQETEVENKIETNKWVTVAQEKYIYNNGGAGWWSKCTVNDIEVDETGIITNASEEEKRIKISYQISADGTTWSQTFTNIQDAENIQYLKVNVEYQTINGVEYGDTSNNKIKVTLNDGSWKITYQKEDGTEIKTQRVYWNNSNKTATITLPTLEGKGFVGWKTNTETYLAGSSYTVTQDITITAFYDDITPQKATIEFDNIYQSVHETVQATVQQSDLESGIDIESSKYIVNNSSDEIGVDSDSWNSAESFTENPRDNIFYTSSRRKLLFAYFKCRFSWK